MCRARFLVVGFHIYFIEKDFGNNPFVINLHVDYIKVISAVLRDGSTCGAESDGLGARRIFLESISHSKRTPPYPQTIITTDVLQPRVFFVEIGPYPIVAGIVKAVLGTLVTSLPTPQRSRGDLKVVTELLVVLYFAGRGVRHEESLVFYCLRRKGQIGRIFQLPQSILIAIMSLVKS
ncbi:hypothetical protein MGYG_08137 [Nannizzia gypsea CBS 118893]|uniref:Uncharacterized protein n=1 Tax=Arthroderma gypseum (strain ATCC MYA-4604 / CBS 118893) TaxID=535722 RepID=E4V551_ARTGP|nr:hypothetical protein MGYG_08137 [Nannizzia gypsea CBS 118893]EFR05125.1 hypothetical protein MGYG_08137 [Nannizzia gypsea CBS 118893]